MADLVLFKLIIMDTSGIYDMFHEICFFLKGISFNPATRF